MNKLYCYADESGQDTQGNLFIVATVITAEEREDLINILELIERDTGKNNLKWHKASHPRRVAYIRRVLNLNILKGKLFYAHYTNHSTRDYLALTARTIGQSIQQFAPATNLSQSTNINIEINAKIIEAIVIMDALPDSVIPELRRQVRQYQVFVKKARGLRKEENHAILRLADALCGFIRDAIEGDAALNALLQRATREGKIKRPT